MIAVVARTLTVLVLGSSVGLVVAFARLGPDLSTTSDDEQRLLVVLSLGLFVGSIGLAVLAFVR